MVEEEVDIMKSFENSKNFTIVFYDYITNYLYFY